MSDIHAGAETSLFSHVEPNSDGKYEIVAKSSSPVTKKLAVALNATLDALDEPEGGKGDPPKLVLLGDILDLSLSPPDRSAQVFKTFIEAIFKEPDEKGRHTRLSRDQVYFVPGNHDHSLWTALKYQTQAFFEGDGGFDRDLVEQGVMTKFQPVTSAFAAPNESNQSWLLRDLLRSATGAEIEVPVFYPNLGDVNSDNSRAVVMHHGHFIESTYKLLSIIVAGFHGRVCGPLTVEELERENGNWIDFGWSTLGENGPIGEDVASFYQFLLTGSHQGRLQNRLADTLAEKLTKALPLPKTNQIREMVSIASKAMIDATVGKFSQTERLSYTSYLGEESIHGLKEYLVGAVGQQMLDRFGNDPQPEQTAFIFGHTHKPFIDHFVVDGRAPKDERPGNVPMFKRPVEVYNTGGWILDTSLLSTKEGASLVFVDDEMNIAELRAFNISTKRQYGLPYVQSLVPGNPMEVALATAVSKCGNVWEEFANTVGDELRLRQDVLLKATTAADQRVAPARERG